jgi:hypothetical protein
MNTIDAYAGASELLGMTEASGWELHLRRMRSR